MSVKADVRIRVCRYRPAAVLLVRGEDALSFLQGQFTQDLRGIEVGGPARYGLWLDRKGKVVADSFIGRQAEGFYLVSYFSSAEAIKARLEAFIIADDVTVEDATVQWAGLAVVGVGAKAWLAAKTNAVAAKASALGGWVFPGRRTARGELGENYEWVFPEENVPEPSGADEIEGAELERMRIAAGIPAVPRDIGGGDLPNEAGLDEDAISYTKGCYLGQEVMARLKSMGQVRRRLVRVAGAGAAPAALPAALFLGEKKIGDVRSVTGVASGWIGLAMVSTAALAERAGYGLAAGGEPVVSVLEIEDEKKA